MQNEFFIILHCKSCPVTLIPSGNLAIQVSVSEIDQLEALMLKHIDNCHREII